MGLDDSSQYYFSYPKTSNIAPIVVPYRSDFVYNPDVPNAFYTFSHECGFFDPTAPGAFRTSSSDSELAAFLQAWAFFGLASEMAGERIDPVDVVTRVPSRSGHRDVIDIRLSKWITTLCDRRMKVVKTLDEQRRGTIVEDLGGKLGYCQVVLALVDRMGRPRNLELDRAILLVRMLWQYAAWVLGGAPDQQFAKRQYPSVEVLVNRMEENGWCAQRIENLFRGRIPFPLLYYLSSLDYMALSRRDHSECLPHRCVGSSSMGNVLQAQHLQDHCRCLEVSAPLEEVVDILRSGGIPLIRITTNRLGKMKLRVVRCTPASRYTAISHVWSDALLGSTRNSVPQCVLEQLASRVSSLPVPEGKGLWIFYAAHNAIHNALWRVGLLKYPSNLDGLIWLDTLCIPQEQHEDLRLQAIARMDLVYSQATQTLVVDSGLKGLIVPSQTVEVAVEDILSDGNRIVKDRVPKADELLGVLCHLYACNWMGRAWTLQEGYLGKDCIAQLGDYSVRLHSLNPMFYRSDGQSPTRRAVTNRKIWPDSAVWKFIPFLWVLLAPFRTILLVAMCYANALMDMFGRPLPYHPKPVAAHFDEEICGLLCQMLRLQISERERLQVSNPKLLERPGTIRLMIARDLLFRFFAAVSRITHAIENDDSSPNGDTQTSSEAGRQLAMAKRSQDLAIFAEIWNSLLGRSTTKPEDLYTIIANMAGLNASRLSRIQGRGERMRSIMYSLEHVPIELLFVDAPRYNGEDDRIDSWIPIVPQGGPVGDWAWLSRTPSGFRLTYEKSHHLYFLAKGTPRTKRWHIPQLLPIRDPSAGTLPFDHCWIEALGNDEESNEDESPEICLIIGTNLPDTYGGSHEALRGARLLVTKREKGAVYLEYDCPIRVLRGPLPPEAWCSSEARTGSAGSGDDGYASECPTFQARRVPFEDVIIIDSGGAKLPPICPRRPENPTFKPPLMTMLLGPLLSLPLFLLLTVLLMLAAAAASVKYNRAQPAMTGAVVFSSWFVSGFSLYFCLYVLQLAAFRSWRKTFLEQK